MNINQLLMMLSNMRIRIEINFERKERVCGACQLPTSQTSQCARADCPLRDDLPEWLKKRED